jgi:hypothetical protein
MNTWVRKSFKVGVLSAGVLLFAGNAASAVELNSAGNAGILTGNQANAQVQAPIDICGNAVAVVGFAAAGCEGGSWATLDDSDVRLNSFGNTGILSGNQLNAQIQAPIDICGNAVGIFGAAQAGCRGGSWATLGGDNGGDDKHGAKHNRWHQKHAMTATHVVKATHVQAHGTEGHVLEATNLNSFGNTGIGVGNQANLGLQLPIDVCGNAVSVVGSASASCEGGATATGGTGDVTANSGFNSGILSGNQVNSLVQIPINVCGNAVGLFGNAEAHCKGGSTATAGGGEEGDDNGGDDNGYSSYSSTPGHAWGEGKTATGVAKHDDGYQGHKGHHEVSGDCSALLNSFGNAGILSGNQANLIAQAPVEISGNAVGVIGASQAGSMGGAWANC